MIWVTERFFNKNDKIRDMAETMQNLPDGMKADRDNVVYFDTEKMQYYIIQWEDRGNGERPVRHYIPKNV